MKNAKRIIVVVGPTASGKSDFAVQLAHKENGEIISADSRQLYKGLDIGTGKITEEEMGGVPHHMLSVYDLDEEVSVARYARDATPILEDILARGKTPIICGGTGQYIDALVYTTTIPKVGPNQALRKNLEEKSTEELFKLLTKKDPLRASSIDPHNKVRIIRALEIIEVLGTVPPQTSSTYRYPTTLYIMNPSRELLRTRVIRRVEKRMHQGMLEEVREVMKKGYTVDHMKKFGLEYVTLGKYIEGTLSESEMKIELVQKIMQYAKRQQTWNKKYLKDTIIVEVKE